MTVSSGSISRAGPFTGDGATVAFGFTFKVFTTADVQVIQADLTGTDTTLIEGTSYSVVLNADQDATPGGTVTLTTALPTGYLLTLLSQIPYAQGLQLTNQGNFSPTVLNDEFDKLTLLTKQLQEIQDRSIVTSPTAPTTPTGYLAELASSVAAAANSASIAAGSTGTLNYAAVRALDSSVVTYTMVQGHTTAGDGGSGWFRVDPSDTTSVDNGGTILVSTDGARWKRVLTSGLINARWFGADNSAVGGVGADSSAAFSAAFAFAKSTAGWVGTTGSPAAANVYAPAGNYNLTLSLDFTNAVNATGHGIGLIGDGLLNTILWANLTEAFPVLDMSGNGLSESNNFSIREGTSNISTAGILRAYVTSDTLGMKGYDSDLLVWMDSCPGIINMTDLHKMRNVTSNGTYGLISGAGNYSGITSKFQTLLVTGDITILTFDNCWFTGGIPAYFTGSHDLLAVGSYFAVTKAAPLSVQGMIFLDQSVSDGFGGGCYQFLRCRTENQTGAGVQDVANPICLVRSNAANQNQIETVQFSGALENNNSSGAQSASSWVYSDANSSANNIIIAAHNSIGVPVLNLLGPVANTSFDIVAVGAIGIGTASQKTNARVDIGPNFTASDFLTLSGSLVGSLGSGSGSAVRPSVSDWVLIARAPTMVAGLTAALAPLVTQNQTYTGGAGWQDFISFVLPGNLLQISAGRIARSVRINTYIASLVAAYDFRITFTQGANVVSFLPYSPTASANRGVIDLVVENVSTTTGGMTARATLSMAVAGATLGDVLLGSSVFDPTADITVAYQGSSASDNPFSLYGAPTFLFA